ncbi:hypothetical protein B1R32_10779 [Abditibacterium utsteinense]|uniref:SmpA / OmlA family protein n=1 Tax=Abditibacterium utsteinense TaxID=1960156 RepID=A0A2S8STC2_9BACT|nr:hypothetical protein [Abditibacterium utsteinense]PQV64054.1 hypothetical protein B1R32_10779 [Abditibacterium utsteinense]
MKKSLKIIFVLACCAIMAIPSFADWREPYKEVAIVRPGKSVGKIAIGMSVKEVRKILGQPTSKEKNCDSWFERTDDGIPAMEAGLSFIFVNYVNGKTVQIASSLRRAVTTDNFGMHSTLSQIQSKMKVLKRVASYDVVDVKEIFYSVKSQGIGFSFTSNESGKVVSSDEPTCFIVFKPGRKIIPSWFSDNSSG